MRPLTKTTNEKPKRRSYSSFSRASSASTSGSAPRCSSEGSPIRGCVASAAT